MSRLMWQEVIVDGDTYMEFIEMGGRTAREQLRMKLPTFGAAPAPRRTDSLLNEVQPSLPCVKEEHLHYKSLWLPDLRRKGSLIRLLLKLALK